MEFVVCFSVSKITSMQNISAFLKPSLEWALEGLHFIPREVEIREFA